MRVADLGALRKETLMDDSTKRAATHLEFALSHMKAALIYWQTEAGGREELRQLAERIAILIDESGPAPER
ncbi:hypothetical protein [Novosphingobium olei]|uniref:Uncharacterized protein n=1 Tax=Novosphingobium olei TaxID=2728851 RepID=A0A7Y0BNY8_9SPHN|nr:hypothetical protein [Novosphingobium olei]NML93986.1 hypothetical protein [Novosphingobium olei]